jgi:hypothetical protein
MKAKKVVLVAVVALLLFYVVAEPAQSAGVVQDMFGGLQRGAEAIVTFMRSLFA